MDEIAKNYRSDIDNLIGFIECELDKQLKQRTWGHIGNLSKLRIDLIEALSQFSGIDAASINESLEDSRA